MNSILITDTIGSDILTDLSTVASERQVLDETSLRHMIMRERRRTERSQQPFLLLLLDLGSQIPSPSNAEVLARFSSALSISIRETDVIGWYKDNAVIGVIFTEINAAAQSSTLAILIRRVTEVLRHVVDVEHFGRLSISFHLYPECWNPETREKYGDATLYPDLFDQRQNQRSVQVAKRGLDIIGSAAALIFLSPVLLVTALLVKLSSRGPVIFRQQRLGRFGKAFELLKFRSMRVDNNPAIHREFMKSVIAGQHDGNTAENGKPVYKMTNDPRVTPIGRLLRKSSLDELPQFLNVLKGDMSLVGPRPPLAYEFSEYQLWHRRRVLEAMPGITGLWQVTGRSRTRFDDMVRLDLQYVRNHSLWLDIQILMKTPAAVLLGNDAF
jgi:lipopolysaccharide/colanic/teichoic acid biosynthesis glycosyltransferase